MPDATQEQTGLGNYFAANADFLAPRGRAERVQSLSSRIKRACVAFRLNCETDIHATR